MISEDKLKEIKEMYPVETKIKLLKDMDDKFPIKAGTIGEIDHIDSEGQLHMKWENGRTLALIPNVDQFEIVWKPEKIKVVIVEPQKEPYIKEIYNTLHEKQEIVGGLIQCVPSFFSREDSYDFIINDEGKLLDLPNNRIIWNGQDIVVGNMIIAKADENTGEFVTLSDEEIKFIIDKIEKECPKVNNSINTDRSSNITFEHDEVER